MRKFQVLAHMLFTTADALELMCARVSRFIKADDISSLRVVLYCIRIHVTCGLRVDRIRFPRWRRKVAKNFHFFQCFTQPLLEQCLSLHVQFVVSLEFPKSWQSPNTCVAPTSLTSI